VEGAGELLELVIAFAIKNLLNGRDVLGGGPTKYYCFPAQTFFLSGASPHCPCPIGRGRSKCPSYHPLNPSTLSPLLKGGEGRGKGRSYTHVLCPFGALLHFQRRVSEWEEEHWAGGPARRVGAAIPSLHQGGPGLKMVVAAGLAP